MTSLPLYAVYLSGMGRVNFVPVQPAVTSPRDMALAAVICSALATVLLALFILCVIYCKRQLLEKKPGESSHQLLHLIMYQSFSTRDTVYDYSTVVTMVFIVTKHAKITSIITLVLCISVKSYSIYVGASLISVKAIRVFL